MRNDQNNLDLANNLSCMKPYLSFQLLLIVLFTLFSCSSDSEDPTPEPEPDVVAPNVTFNIAGSSNTNSGTTPVFSNQITIDISAQDAGGVAKVEAYINDQKVGEDVTSPFQIVIDLTGYTSKIPSSGKFQDYMLKIVATDTSGNQGTTEQVIHIDNELPAITNVSMESGGVINGDTNLVTFSVSDNEGLSSVAAYMNNSLLQQFTDDNYEVNLNSLNLSDGDNTLRIVAIDLANNTATFEVPLIVDNTGPEITLESLSTNQIVDEALTLTPEILDEYSDVVSVEILVGEDSQVLFEEVSPYEWTFDPELFTTGPVSVFIKSMDSMGNESISEYPIEIYRRLIIINFPNQNVNYERLSYYVFASSMEGELLSVQKVDPENSSIVLNTSINMERNEDFMLTFADQIAGRFGETNELTTIQNIPRNIISEINLNAKPQFRSNFNPTYPIWFNINQNIWSNQDSFWQLSGGGSFDTTVFNVAYMPVSGNPPPEQIAIEWFENISTNIQSEKVFLKLLDRQNKIGSYALIDFEDLTNDFILTPDLFINNSNEFRQVEMISNGAGNGEYGELWIRGYLNQSDFENNIYHDIESIGYELSVVNKEYWFSNIFEQYRTTVRLNNYVVESIGEPQLSYSPLDWSLSFTFNNNIFSITENSNDEAIMGQIFISDNLDLHQGGGTINVMNGREQSYKWSLIYDLKKQNNVALPTIPSELTSWKFYENYQAQDHTEKQVEIRKYENITSYLDYLNKVIKNNTYWYLESPKKEILYNSGNTGAYNNPSHFILD